jgi:uncharacterized damage-inducible protein DinB
LRIRLDIRFFYAKLWIFKGATMTIAQTLLPEFDHEMAGCRKTLERVPDGQFEYRPHPKSFTLGQLANHLATMAGWMASTMNNVEMDFTAPEVRAAMPAPVHTRQELLEIFDGGVAEGRALLAAASDADLLAVWTGKAEGKVLFAMPRTAVLRSFILNHAIHHRAQLCVYLRLLDLPVPALYGPSADETGM